MKFILGTSFNIFENAFFRSAHVKKNTQLKAKEKHCMPNTSDVEQLERSMWRLETPLPSAAYMHEWIGSAMVQTVACRLFGAKPLSKPMPGYCQLDPYKQTSVKC